MSDLVLIRPVAKADVPLLHEALEQLSLALGDRHVADAAALEAAGFGPHPAYRALLALSQGKPVGALVWSQLFSTTRGGAGLYVSDLWVAPAARGNGLGKRLLARALVEAGKLGAAHFLKLAVYDDNPLAHRFYRDIGFSAQTGETSMILHGPALDILKGQP